MRRRGGAFAFPLLRPFRFTQNVGGGSPVLRSGKRLRRSPTPTRLPTIVRGSGERTGSWDP